MKSLVQILTEAYKPKLGKIGDLNRIKYIRHYTTAHGLIGMLEDGYIHTHMSQGDFDWIRYNKGGSNVVSFHDARYDTEWPLINQANEAGYCMSRTKTLGLHMDQICACIEYDFTELPKNIQDSCGIIQILEVYIEDFFFAWRNCIDFANSIKKPEDILIQCPDYVYPDYDAAKNKDKWLKDMYSFLMRIKDVKITEEDCKDLLDYAIHRQTQKLINKLLKLGWKKGDENNPLYMWFNELHVMLTGEPGGRIDRADFLAYIAKHITKSINDKINIEIRIGADVPLKYAKRIIIFDGIVDDSIAEEVVFDMNEKIAINEDKYNIVRVPPYETINKLR